MLISRDDGVPADSPPIAWQPSDRQALFLSSCDDEVLYGGAAGGGKSDAILIDALGLQQAAITRPGYRAILFRRSYPELRDLIDRSRTLYPLALRGTEYSETSREWRFPSGAKVEFGYCESDADRFRYQGREYSYIGWDELTLYPTSLPYDFLLTRLRSTDPKIRTYCRATCNPGGVGHEWVREYWRISDDGSATKHSELVGDRTFTRRFIPARLSDNPHLTGTGYRASLMRQSVQTRRALLDGRWDVVEITGIVFAVSVTLNETRKPSGKRFKLPSSTMPPILKLPVFGASPSCTCVGVKKNTKLLRIDLVINTTAITNKISPAAIKPNRL